MRRSPAASTLIAPSVVRPCCFRGMVCQGDPRASCSDARSTRSAAPLLAVGLPQRTRSRNHHATLMVGTPCVVRRRGAAASTAIVADAAATAASTVHAATHLVRSSCCFVRRRQGSHPRHEPTAPHSAYARPLWWTMTKTDDDGRRLSSRLHGLASSSHAGVCGVAQSHRARWIPGRGARGGSSQRGNRFPLPGLSQMKPFFVFLPPALSQAAQCNAANELGF